MATKTINETIFAIRGSKKRTMYNFYHCPFLRADNLIILYGEEKGSEDYNQSIRKMSDAHLNIVRQTLNFAPGKKFSLSITFLFQTVKERKENKRESRHRKLV